MAQPEWEITDLPGDGPHGTISGDRVAARHRKRLRTVNPTHAPSLLHCRLLTRPTPGRAQNQCHTLCVRSDR